MSRSEDNEFKFTPFVPDTNLTASTTTPIQDKVGTKNTSKIASAPIEVVTIDSITLNIYLKFSYNELEAFVDELMRPNEYLRSVETGQCVSTLHQYALESTREPIDMSNQSVRTTYRPNLFTRKNDAFGPWNFNFLLTLLELDYQYDGADGKDFPKVWKTGPTTKVRVNKVSKNAHQTSAATTTTTTASTEQQQDEITLIGLLQVICRQNTCDESDAALWLRALKGTNMQIYSGDQNYPTT
jgi:hypothetical protein